MRNSTFLVIAAVCMVIFLLMFNRALNLMEYVIMADSDVNGDSSDGEMAAMELKQNTPIGFVIPSQPQ